MEAFRGFVAEAEALKVEAEALLLKKMLIPAQNKVQEAKSKRLRAELLLSAGISCHLAKCWKRTSH